MKKIINKEKIITLLTGAITSTIICFIGFALFYNFYMKNLVTTKTKIEKQVSITENGIAEAVEKVYDAVTVVESLKNNQVYQTGTGFVFKIDEQYGYILTNHHVIEGAEKIQIILTNQEKIKANIVGSDEYSDIAVLKINKDQVIKIAPLGNSVNLKVGDTLFAVGAPLDAEIYSNSVTRGILSGKNRLVEVTNNKMNTYIMEVLQTDTAINSGNSGGPLCNSNGEVIGITNMKLASTAVEGMGFAIPIETAEQYANIIIEGKTIERPYLGISIYEAKTMFTSTSEGIYIESVVNNSPAEKAGLQAGDKITKINNVDIKSVSYFKYTLYKQNVGSTIKLTYIRNNQEKTVDIKLESQNQKA